MAILYKKDLTTAKKLPLVGLDLMQEIITSLSVRYLTNWAKMTFACKSKTFKSLYSHGLLIKLSWQILNSKLRIQFKVALQREQASEIWDIF